MRSREVQELVQQIDAQPWQSVRKDNLFDSPVRVYLVLKTMFQNFKKEHELELMQERVFTLKVDPSSYQRASLTKVTAASLFKFHSLTEEDLLLLVEMKEYLKEDVKAELYGQILEGIEQLGDVGEVMKCYRALLNLEFINRKKDMYACIEEKMVAKLVSMPLVGRDFKVIAKNILALPVIRQSVLVLISHLYEKIGELSDFTHLFKIFKENYPQQPTPTDQQALIRICLPETLEIIDLSNEAVAKIAEAEAISKLQRMELIMTTKTKAILNFIVQVVRFGRPIWHQIIEWEHRAAQQPKNFLKVSLEGILIEMLQNKKYFETVLGIIEKITQIDQHSEIGLIFVRELLKLENKEYLSHRIIRRFLAIKILKYNSSEDYSKQIFGKGFKFIEVILEMFNLDNSISIVTFYHHILNHEESEQLLTNYLKQLSECMPVKFKEFFLKCNTINQGEIFGNANSTLLRLLGESIGFETAVNMVRDLAFVPPSRCLIPIFTRLLVTFAENKQVAFLKQSIARSLNLILIRNSKDQLNSHFKIHLPGIIRDYLRQESGAVFENVSEETNAELKRFYEDYNKKK